MMGEPNVLLQFDFQACTYGSDLHLFIDAVDEVGNHGLALTSAFGDFQLPLPSEGLVLSGSANYPVKYGPNPNTRPSFWPYGLIDNLAAWPEPVDVGNASVTWSFEPVPTPTPTP